MRLVLPFLVNHICSASFLRQFRRLYRSRSLNSMSRRRSLVRIAANLGLRPHGHLSACPQYPTQSGPWIRSLPLRAYSVEGGRLRADHHNRGARTRLASEYISVSPHLNCTSGTSPIVYKIVHRFHAYTGFDKLRYIFWTTQLSPFNHPVLSLISVTKTFLLTCVTFPSQCARRHLKCEYPLESRRGMRKRRSLIPRVSSTTPEINPDRPRVNLVKANRKRSVDKSS